MKRVSEKSIHTQTPLGWGSRFIRAQPSGGDLPVWLGKSHRRQKRRKKADSHSSGALSTHILAKMKLLLLFYFLSPFLQSNTCDYGGPETQSTPSH